MKYFLITLVFISVFFLKSPAIKTDTLKKTNYTILPNSTKIIYTTQIGGSTNLGSIITTKGELTLDGLNLVNANIEFDVNSINSFLTDSLKNNEVIKTLTSENFFNVKKHSKLLFVLSDSKSKNIVPYLTVNGKTIQYSCYVRVADLGKNRVALLVEPFLLKFSDFYTNEDGSKPENKNSLEISFGITATKTMN